MASQLPLAPPCGISCYNLHQVLVYWNFLVSYLDSYMQEAFSLCDPKVIEVSQVIWSSERSCFHILPSDVQYLTPFSFHFTSTLQRIDNVPILQIDMVWCYFMLRDISWLSMAGVRLAKARQGIERSYGKDCSRVRLLQAGRHPELSM